MNFDSCLKTKSLSFTISLNPAPGAAFSSVADFNTGVLRYSTYNLQNFCKFALTSMTDPQILRQNRRFLASATELNANTVNEVVSGLSLKFAQTMT